MISATIPIKMMAEHNLERALEMALEHIEDLEDIQLEQYIYIDNECKREIECMKGVN